VETKDSVALDLNSHYQKAHDLQPVDIADAWDLDRYEFSALKYLYRRGNKDGNTRKSDLLKAIWYLVYALSKDKKLAGMVIELVKLNEKYKETDNDTVKQEAHSKPGNKERPFEHWSN
jgi:hypothetical protein